MSYQHKNLAAGGWGKLSFVEQMANIGSEVERALTGRARGMDERSQRAFERALELMDEAETRDPFLPSWCVEERGIALFGLGRYEDGLSAFAALPNKTYRSRCYESVCYSALGDDESAAQAVAKALQIYPELTAKMFGLNELYKRREDWKAIRNQLIAAGLPK